MLSLLSAERRDYCGLTDPEDPMITVHLLIEQDKEPHVILTPTDGDSGLFTVLIARRIQDSPAPKVPGSYTWKVRQFGDLVTIADDANAARFLFSLFRRDLAPAFEVLEEMVKTLPTKAGLQEVVDEHVTTRLQWMLCEGKVIDPRELRLSVLCHECGSSELGLRRLGLGEELKAVLEGAIGRLQEQGVMFKDDTLERARRAFRRVSGPPPKDNELFLPSTVAHDHPFFDLNVQLLTEAASALLRERAPIVALEFLRKTEKFSMSLDELIR